MCSEECANNGTIVHASEGLYAISKDTKGVFHPVHVRKITGTNAISFCEDDVCRRKKRGAEGGGNLTYECSHNRSIVYAEPGVVNRLEQSSLEELVKDTFLRGLPRPSLCMPMPRKKTFH